MFLTSSYVGASAALFNGTYVSEADQIVYTFAGVPIGPATPDRQVVVVVYQVPKVVSTAVVYTNTVDIGFYPASYLLYHEQFTYSLEIWATRVPSGTTVDIVVEAGDTLESIEIAVFSMYNMHKLFMDSPNDIEAGFTGAIRDTYRNYATSVSTTSFTLPIFENGFALAVEPGSTTITGFANTFTGTYISGAYGLTPDANPALPFTLSAPTVYAASPWGAMSFGP